MVHKSRIIVSQNNLIFSLIYNITITVLNFVTRTIFIHTLGAEYLGLNGLFTNVLSILSLAELGVGSAITYSLYKPIADRDNERIKSLMRLYAKAYRVIGWAIFLLGIALIPVLKYIVNLNVGVEINYYIIYIMFLLNTVISYWFFAYRSVIIYANQEGYILTNIETGFAILRSLVQFIVLLTLKNYYLYLLLPILLGITKNIVISKTAGSKYPIINEKNAKPLKKSDIKKIFQDVFALSLFKISSVVYGATDNIIISTFLGTYTVGLVSNFTLIIQLVTSYVNMIFQSMYASVGNLNVSESVDYKYTIFKRLNLLNFWIYTYCSICLGCFLNPCIKVWLGEVYCMDISTVILLSIVFLIPGLNNIINVYKDACGLFKEVQIRSLATAIVNLCVSIILVKLIGLNGVYLGTIIAYLTTIYVVDCRVVFKIVFELSVIKYYISLLKKMMLIVFLFPLSLFIVNRFNITSWLWLILVWLLITVIINGILFLIYRNTEEFEYLKGIFFSFVGRLKAKMR